MLTYFKVITSFEGGSEAFLSLVFSSHITDLSSLRQMLTIHEPLPRHVMEFREAMGADAPSFQSLVIDFFKGSGVPCAAAFDEMKDALPHIVDLSRVDDPGFRVRMFVWASTGAPFASIGEEEICVSP